MGLGAREWRVPWLTHSALTFPLWADKNRNIEDWNAAEIGAPELAWREGNLQEFLLSNHSPVLSCRAEIWYGDSRRFISVSIGVIFFKWIPPNLSTSMPAPCHLTRFWLNNQWLVSTGLVCVKPSPMSNRRNVDCSSSSHHQRWLLVSDSLTDGNRSSFWQIFHPLNLPSINFHCLDVNGIWRLCWEMGHNQRSAFGKPWVWTAKWE